MIGVGYRPRSGTIFFTRNGKKLDEVAHGLRTPNFFPTIGANGPCMVHVNFGQLGFVFIEANVKKWGLAPMTGSLAPPPPYGSEQGSILLESGRESAAQISQRVYQEAAGRTVRIQPPLSPGPLRSPTDISLAPLSRMSSGQGEDVGEGSSRANTGDAEGDAHVLTAQEVDHVPPPEYTSPSSSRRSSDDRPSTTSSHDQPPIPSYDAAVAMRNGHDSDHEEEDGA